MKAQDLVHRLDALENRMAKVERTIKQPLTQKKKTTTKLKEEKEDGGHNS